MSLKSSMRIVKKAISTPWKFFLEMIMLTIRPVVLLSLGVQGVKVGNGSKFYGFPRVMKHRGSRIVIGKKFENRNWWDSNPLGINHPTIFATWGKDAQIVIGDDVGISGGCICARTSITIGDGTLIGANCTIIDTDFHPVRSSNRRYDLTNIKSAPIVIGKNVFIGTGAIILKGATISDNAIIGAGQIVR